MKIHEDEAENTKIRIYEKKSFQRYIETPYFRTGSLNQHFARLLAAHGSGLRSLPDLFLLFPWNLLLGT